MKDLQDLKDFDASTDAHPPLNPNPALRVQGLGFGVWGIRGWG